MPSKRTLSKAESEAALAARGGALVPSFSSPAPLKGAAGKAAMMNELAESKIDEFAKSNPQLTGTTLPKLSKFGIGTPIALRHPQTGEVTPMVLISGRYHHPSTFVRTAGHTDEYIPTTTGISTEMGHDKYGTPMKNRVVDESEADANEAQAQAVISSNRDRRFRMRGTAAPLEPRQPGLLDNLGVRHTQLFHAEGMPATYPHTTTEVNPPATGNMLSGGDLMSYVPIKDDKGQRTNPNTHLPSWMPKYDYQFSFMPKEEADRRAEVASSNMARIHSIPRRAGESAYDHVNRGRGLMTRAQSLAVSEAEKNRKADYFEKFGKEMPQPSRPGKSELNTDAVPNMGSVSETLYPVKAVPAKAPTKTLNVEGASYMHPEDFQRRKAAGLKVPNYKLASGGASYVMEKTPVFNPKLDDEGKHIHNDEGVPQYTKSYTVAPKDYTKKAEVKLKMVKGYKRPLSQDEYDYVQANIKKIQKKTKSNKLDPETRDAFDNDARAAARDAAERATAKARRESFEAAFNK